MYFSRGKTFSMVDVKYFDYFLILFYFISSRWLSFVFRISSFDQGAFHFHSRFSYLASLFSLGSIDTFWWCSLSTFSLINISSPTADWFSSSFIILIISIFIFWCRKSGRCEVSFCGFLPEDDDFSCHFSAISLHFDFSDWFRAGAVAWLFAIFAIFFAGWFSYFDFACFDAGAAFSCAVKYFVKHWLRGEILLCSLQLMIFFFDFHFSFFFTLSFSSKTFRDFDFIFLLSFLKDISCLSMRWLR